MGSKTVKCVTDTEDATSAALEEAGRLIFVACLRFMDLSMNQWIKICQIPFKAMYALRMMEQRLTL